MTTDQRTITNPAALHDPTPFGYSHAVSAPGKSVFIGGQYASDATGAPEPGDFAAQRWRYGRSGSSPGIISPVPRSVFQRMWATFGPPASSDSESGRPGEGAELRSRPVASESCTLPEED